MSKKYKNIFLLFFLSFLFFANSHVSLAAELDGDDGGDEGELSDSLQGSGNCSVVTETFKSNVKNSDLNISRTMLDVFTGGVFIPIPVVYSVGADDLVGCAGVVRAKISQITNTSLFVPSCGAINEDVCSTTDTSVCEELINNQTESGAPASTTMRGSLLGMANQLEDIAYNEPLPVNLAYFWNQSIAKVPFANKALAATDPAENMPMIQVAYFAWKAVRDISLALVSLVLLYAGIMIIMRKKVNQQLVVSVQYAIPRILIGILFIIFSYAIGATIAALGWGLFRGGSQIVYSQFLGVSDANISDSLVLLWIVQTMMQSAMGAIFGLILLIIVGAFIIILKFILYFKAFFIYIKMIFAIITAPLEFALGTVPGSEGIMVDWFKKMAKYVLTLLFMGIIISLTLVLSLGVVIAYECGQGSEIGGWGVMMGLLAPLAIVIMGFGFGIGAEGKVDALFFGGGKKR